MNSILGIFSSRPRQVEILAGSRQCGVSLIAGIFLLLLMAVLAAGMVSLVSTAHVNLAADIGGSKAYQAARAGVEWGLYQLDPNASSSTLPACVSGAPPIPGHTVSVSCTSSDYTEAGRSIRIYRIVSVAKANGVRAPGIERQVEATVEKCRNTAITAPPYDC